MVKRFKNLISITLLFASFNAAPACAFFLDSAAPKPEDTQDVIVIDPGHGGFDSGARGPKGVEEKNVTLRIARLLAEKLREKFRCKVLLTRDDDVFIPLRDRTAFANMNKADLFISIHTNATPKSDVDGVETFFASIDATDEDAKKIADFENSSGADEKSPEAEDDLKLILRDLENTASNHESSILAETIHTALLKATKGEDRGVKQALFAVLISAEMPAVLVEVGFITNPDEERRLNSRKEQEKIADSLADGIMGFRKTFSKEKDFIGFLNSDSGISDYSIFSQRGVSPENMNLLKVPGQ